MQAPKDIYDEAGKEALEIVDVDATVYVAFMEFII